MQESFFIVQCFWKLGLILLFRWIQLRGECSLCIGDEGMKNWCKASWEIHRFIFSWFSVVSCYQHVDSLDSKKSFFQSWKTGIGEFCCWHDWGSTQWALLAMPKVLWRYVADYGGGVGGDDDDDCSRCNRGSGLRSYQRELLLWRVKERSIWLSWMIIIDKNGLSRIIMDTNGLS